MRHTRTLSKVQVRLLDAEDRELAQVLEEAEQLERQAAQLLERAKGYRSHARDRFLETVGLVLAEHGVEEVPDGLELLEEGGARIVAWTEQDQEGGEVVAPSEAGSSSEQ